MNFNQLGKKMAIRKQYLEVLKQNPTYQEVIKDLKLEKPIVPVYDHVSDNTEEWKAKSNMQRGFNLVLSLLGESYE